MSGNNHVKKTIHEVKQQAKELIATNHLTYTQALHELATKAGFKRWDTYKKELEAQEANTLYKVVLTAYEHTVLFEGSFESSQNFINKLKGIGAINCDAFHDFIAGLREKHDLPPFNSKTIGIYPKSANSHKSSAIETFAYFTPEAHSRYSYPEIIAKHCAGEEGRNTSGPFYEYTLVANDELARDLEESGVCFEFDWSDNSEHPDFGKSLIIFTITK